MPFGGFGQGIEDQDNIDEIYVNSVKNGFSRDLFRQFSNQESSNAQQTSVKVSAPAFVPSNVVAEAKHESICCATRKISENENMK